MSLLRNTYYFLPPGMRRLVRRVWYLPSDLVDSMSGRRGPMIPPKGRIFIGSGDFADAGEAIRVQLVELAGLKPATVEEAMVIKGIGPAKAETILPAFLELIQEHGQRPG